MILTKKKKVKFSTSEIFPEETKEKEITPLQMPEVSKPQRKFFAKPKGRSKSEDKKRSRIEIMDVFGSMVDCGSINISIIGRGKWKQLNKSIGHFKL